MCTPCKKKIQAASLVISVGVHERREGRYPSARILSRKALMTMLMRTPSKGRTVQVRTSTQALLRTSIKTHMKLYVNIILGIIEPSNEQIELIDYNQDNENNIFDILKIVDHVLNN